jgi:hypothetical protein
MFTFVSGCTLMSCQHMLPWTKSSFGFVCFVDLCNCFGGIDYFIFLWYMPCIADVQKQKIIVEVTP